ncbi:hypothetical protein [Fibrella arboris]|uniref:hypothetical protein n=1 Tax=Fibrella arboris TaxID=3242486 RepID=UPI0035203A7B
MPFPLSARACTAIRKRGPVQAAIETVMDFLQANPGFERLLFVCFDAANLALYEQALGTLV